MIVVKLELWPGGDESKKQDLGTAHISNISGGAPLSSYRVELFKAELFSRHAGEIYKRGTVPIFPRRDRRWGPWELLALALDEVVGARILTLKQFVRSHSCTEAARRREDPSHG